MSGRPPGSQGYLSHRPVPPGLKHNKRSWARWAYLCDCYDCNKNTRQIIEDRSLTPLERHQRSRAKLRGTPVPDRVKHGIYAYQVYGCRCDLCAKAKAEAGRAKRNAWRATARGHWVDLPGDRTVVHWPPRNAPEGWTCPTCGEEPRHDPSLQAL